REPPGSSPAAPRAAVLDLARLVSRLGDDPEGAALLLREFDAKAADSLARVRGAVQTGDPRAVEQAAHKFRGARAGRPAAGAAQAASRLEKLGASGDLSGAAAAVEDLERGVRAVREEILRDAPRRA